MVLSSKGSKEIFDTTGGYFFTRCFFEIVKKYTEGVVAFPTDYFFPFPNEKDFHLKVKNAKDYIQDCSYALLLGLFMDAKFKRKKIWIGFKEISSEA